MVGHLVQKLNDTCLSESQIELLSNYTHASTGGLSDAVLQVLDEAGDSLRLRGMPGKPCMAVNLFPSGVAVQFHVNLYRLLSMARY